MKTIFYVSLFVLPALLITQCEQEPEIPFHDQAFLNALIEDGVDTNGDGKISYIEAENVDSLDVSGHIPGQPNHYRVGDPGDIESLEGIEAFINLIHLQCNYNKLQSIDISKNPLLVELNCMENQITALDVSNNLRLEYLWVSDNKITSLDVTNNIALKHLICTGNHLSFLDVSHNKVLIELWCPSNLLTNIDLQNNRKLKALNCCGNPLVSLDISNNNSIDYLLLQDMETLFEVCVWTMPFPPDGFRFFGTENSPNLYFTTDCSQ